MQHISKSLMGQKGSPKGNLNKYIELNKIKIQHIKNCGKQLKQGWEGNLGNKCIHHKREKNPKQSSKLPLHDLGKGKQSNLKSKQNEKSCKGKNRNQQNSETYKIIKNSD